jgi:ribosome-binding factor A
MKKNRTERLADHFRKEISDILLRDVKDPRIGFITLTSVSISRDLKHAKVYFSMMEEGEGKKKETTAALRKAAGFIRYRLYKNLRLKYSPELEFFLDESLQKAARIEKTLREITGQDDQD